MKSTRRGGDQGDGEAGKRPAGGVAGQADEGVVLWAGSEAGGGEPEAHGGELGHQEADGGAGAGEAATE